MPHGEFPRQGSHKYASQFVSQRYRHSLSEKREMNRSHGLSLPSKPLSSFSPPVMSVASGGPKKALLASAPMECRMETDWRGTQK